MICYIEEEESVDKSYLIDKKIFKLTSGNIKKYLRMQQNIYRITQTIKTILK